MGGVREKMDFSVGREIFPTLSQRLPLTVPDLGVVARPPVLDQNGPSDQTFFILEPSMASQG